MPNCDHCGQFVNTASPAWVCPNGCDKRKPVQKKPLTPFKAPTFAPCHCGLMTGSCTCNDGTFFEEDE